MVRHVRVNRQGRTHAPARYLLRLHPDDLALVDDSRRWFTEGLTHALRQAATENGWLLDGKVDIDYEADPGRHPGVPTALAVPPEAGRGSAPADPPPAPLPGPTSGSRGAGPQGLGLVRTDTGERVVLGERPVTVGRGRDRSLTVDDKRVSRSHARIEASGGGWAVSDEGSANGTRLNGAELSPHVAQMLRVGDTITVGPVELKVVPGPAEAEPGTRALDDGDRTRISQQVLPPPRRERS